MIDWQIEETLTMFPRRLLSVVLTFRGKNSTNGIHRFSYLWKQFFEFDSFIWTIYLNHYFESFIWIIYLSYLFYSFIWIKPLPFLAHTKTQEIPLFYFLQTEVACLGEKSEREWPTTRLIWPLVLSIWTCAPCTRPTLALVDTVLT